MTELQMYVLPIIIIPTVLIIAVAAGGAGIGRAIGGKAPAKNNFWCLLISALCTAAATANYVLNMGWYRVIMLWFLLPFWYVLLLFMASKSASACIEHKGIRAMFVACHICFVLSGLLLPDGGDEGGAYMLFGLIRDCSEKFTGLAVVLFIASLALMIAQMVVAGALKEKKKIQTAE